RGDRNERRQHSRTDTDDANTSDNATTSGDADTEADSGDNHDRFDRGSDRTDRNDRNQRYDRNDRNDRNDRDDDRRGRRGRRNRRGRDRDNDNYDNDNRNDNRDNQNSRDNRDDQLQVVAGILDVVDNNVAFVRTSGYHAGPADVYVNSQMVRRLGLRSGDAITGSVRMTDTNDRYNNNRGRNRQKYNPLARVDSVNGMTVEEAKNRPEFNKLTPLYPNQRIRLETEPGILTTRVIDLIMPIGKGQRALIVSPPKAGKTTILQNIANAIATNRPECYLMVVLVDERPEEVTDMQRSVKGEVIASTFDRPPAEHTAVAELAIERAKRLVEQGQDVVVLLDSITRLGRAYNNSSPASGRILSGGVDSNALYPPKRFLGAARNIENGGSLTIIATAMVETGSAGDTVIFEEFKGTGNAELKLDRKIAERRVFPAVDIGPSGTRKDELLLAPEEARVMHKLRGILSVLDNQQAIDTLIAQLKKYKTNGEFLAQVAAQRAFMSNGED
ncbi:MAG: transcription termination factor Rho, partial [Corynebacterium matruchotii]